VHVDDFMITAESKPVLDRVLEMNNIIGDGSVMYFVIGEQA